MFFESRANAQAFPSKPIRMVVGFAPGGANDTLARILSIELNKSLGQPVIVDNRPGAGGTIGAEVVAKAPPDGHTLLLGSTGTNGIAPSLYSKLPYDQMKDLAPVSLVARSANLLVVNPSMPAKNVRELVALAKSQPGKLNYASSGVGSTLHLAMELFKSMAGVNIVHVPYKGDALALADVMVGNVDMSLLPIPPALPQAKAGKLRILAISSGKRMSTLPAVPTVAESGVPGYDFSSWYGVFAGGATSGDTIERLAQEVHTAIAQPQVKTQIDRQGVEPAVNSPAEFRRLVADEIAKWGKVVKSVGVKLD
jgi:tripartite-type tricarboxylate transporter receptor subunit TctC